MVLINNYKEYKLDNGLVVALQKTPTETITTKLRVHYGAIHEKEGEEGLAHLLEHCIIRGGSRKYDSVTTDDIMGSFGFYNANTEAIRTNFWAEMLSEDIEKWLDIVSDFTFRPRLNQLNVEREIEIVLREVSDRKSNPVYNDDRKFSLAIYGDHPKGRLIIGREEVIKNADPDKLRDFHDRGYHPNNMDLIIAGGLPDNIEEMVSSYFGSFPQGENTRIKLPSTIPLKDKTIFQIYSPERINKENPEESSAQIALYFTAPESGHPDEYSAKMMNSILGANSDSMLYQSIRNKKGLAYVIGSRYDDEYNFGEMGINASIPAKKIEESIDSIFEEMDNMKKEKVNNKLLEKMKRSVQYNIAKTFETNDGHIYAIQLNLDRGVTSESVMKDYDKVTPERVMEVANKYLPDRETGKYVLHILNPLKED